MHIQGITFSSDVEVDGNTYEDCTFQKCIIMYKGGQRPMYIRCKFSDVTFAFDGAAGNTIGYLSDLFHNGFRKQAEKVFKTIRIAKPIGHGEVGH